MKAADFLATADAAPAQSAADFLGGGAGSAEGFLTDNPENAQWEARPGPNVWERLRRSASNVLGPTETQKLEEGVTVTDGEGNLKRVYQPAGGKVEQEGFLPALSHPAVAIPRLKPSETDGDEEMIGKALYNTAAGFLEFGESPLGVATAGVGALPGLVKGTVPITREAVEAARLTKNLHRAVAGGYAADMASKVPEAAAQAGTVSVTGTPQDSVEAFLGLGANVVLPGLLGAAAGEARTVPERPETLQSQVDMLDAGRRDAVLVTPGAEMPGFDETKYQPVETKAGTFIINPEKLRPDEVQAAVKEDRIGEVLGYGIATKPKPGTEVGAVTVRGPDGLEKQAVVTDAENLDKVLAAAQRVAGPEDTVTIEDGVKTISDRLQPPEEIASVTERLSAWADQTIAESQKRLNAGLDPMLMAAYAVKGAVLIKNGVQDFGQWSAEMARQFGETVRPHLEALYQQAGGLASDEGLRAFGLKIQASDKIEPVVKEAIANYTYTKGSNVEDLAGARQLLAAHGVDGAIRLYQNPRAPIPEEVRSALGGELLRQTGEDYQRAKAAGDRAAAEMALAKQVDVANTRLARGTTLAKALQAESIYDRMSPVGAVRHARKIFEDAGKGMPPELNLEIVRRANDIAAIPEGFLRDRAATQLLNYITQQKGIHWWDLATSIWYANAVSGLATEVHVAIDNIGQFAGNALVNVLRAPLAVPELARGAGRGLAKGVDQAREILRTGIVTGVRDQVQVSHPLENHPIGVLHKYVGRVLSANHVLMFKPAMEMKQALMARDLARRQGLSGAELRQKVADLLGNTTERVKAAKAQASAEGLSGLDLRRRAAEIIEQQREQFAPGSAEDARQYALRSTYLQEPYGVAGFTAQRMGSYFRELAERHPIAGVLAKITTAPFMRIAGNILDEKLNWTPVGALRAWRGQRTGELYGKPITDERAVGDLYTKAIVGTAATAALASLATVTGNGPANPEARRQLMQTGWKPHAIKVGNTYVDYLRTPMALPLAVVGGWQDAQRYRHLDDVDAWQRTGFALASTADTILSQSYLDSVGRVFEAVKNPDTRTGGQNLEQLFARTASKFVVPNAVNEIDRLFDPTLYEKNGVRAMILQQIPFARRENKPVINVLGEPVKSGLFDRDLSVVKPDALWQVIAAKQAWIPEPSRNTIVGDKKDGPGNFRALTPDELYTFTKISGENIRTRLMGDLADLRDMTPEEAKEHVRNVVEEERKDAKEIFVP